MKKLLVLFLSLVAVDHAQAVQFNYRNIIGSGPNAGPSNFVGDIYNFGLAIAGLLAFGAIVYGAIKYTVSAGNPSQQSDAKEWISQALWGLLLLVGAYLILNTINPQLVNLRDPTLP